MAYKTGIFVLILSSWLSFSAYSKDYRSGDIILVSLPCYICSLIELEEDSNFSHIGLINKEGKETFVYEAWGKVKKTPLKEFLSRTSKGQVVRIKRLKNQSFSNMELAHYFEEYYQGLRYDSSFLWDNYDSKGNERYYCSEFVYKFLHHFTKLELNTKRMHFDQYRDIWEKFFKGNVPDGKIGLSPEDFNQAKEFTLVEDLYQHD